MQKLCCVCTRQHPLPVWSHKFVLSSTTHFSTNSHPFWWELYHPLRITLQVLHNHYLKRLVKRTAHSLSNPAIVNNTTVEKLHLSLLQTTQQVPHSLYPPRPVKQTTHFRPCRATVNGTQGKIVLLKKLYARYDQDQRFCGLTTERDLEGQTVLWSVAQPARAEGSVQDSDQSGSAPTRYEISAVDTDTAERAEVPDVPDGTLPLRFYQPVEDQQSEIATVASVGNNEARSQSSSSMYTSSPPSGSSFSLGRPRAKSLVASSESSMSTPTTESKNLAEELPPVASKDSDSTGVISNTTKSAHRCDATDASCDPRKHRMNLRPASSSGSSFDWFADGDDNWTDAKYDDLFDELSVARVPPPEDSSEPQYDTLQVWNATEGVWEDMTYQLDHSGMLWDDQNVIGLQVKLLMEQAKKLAALHNRVTNVQTQCQQLLDSLFKDLVKEEEALGVRSLFEKRKLLLRLCDLEERILCAEIGSQHTSIDSFVLLQGLKEIRNTVCDELQQEFSLPGQLQLRLKITQRVLHSPCPPSPDTLSSRSGDHPHLQYITMENTMILT